MIGKLIRFRMPPGTIPDQALDLPDTVLVSGCAVRDEKAMERLFDRHAESVYRFLSRLCGAGADVEDLTHATFVEAFRSAGRFRRGSQVRTWLFGIALNVTRHYQRSESRRRAFLRVWAVQARSGGALPDRLAEGRQLVGRLEQALAGLRPDLRAVYVLCDVEELRGTEAAAALGIRPGTLGRRLHEARKALRAAVVGPV